VAKTFYPKIVELHNYASSNSLAKKIYNWETLNTKVFLKDNFRLTREDIEHVSNSTVGAIEYILYNFKKHTEQRSLEKNSLQNSPPPPIKPSPPSQPGRLKNEVTVNR
jgi:hypothetical protein